MTRDIRKASRLWRYLRPYWHFEVLAFLTLVALSALGLALPASIQYMIDSLIPALAEQGTGGDPTPVLLFALFLLGIYLAVVLFSWLRDYFGARLGTGIVQDLRAHLMAHLQRLSFGFYQRRQAGEVVSRVMSDAAQIEKLLTEVLLMFVLDVLVLIAIIVYLARTNPMLTLVAVLPVPLTVLSTQYFGKRLHRFATLLQETTASLSARVYETLTAIKTTRAFGQEQQEQQKVGRVLAELTDVTVRASVLSSFAVNVVQFINMVGPIVVLGWGVWLVANGNMKLGELIAFFMLLTYLYSPVQSLARARVQFHQAMASVDRLFEYLDIAPEVIESGKSVSPESIRGEYRLESATYSYPDSSFALCDLSLHIHAGEKVALVGPSGSGKTTLISLLLRFVDPDTGAVTLDGIDLRHWSFGSLRRHVALVEQDPMLFKASVRENIAYGRPDAALEQVIEAARRAHIHEFIMALPGQYEAEIGERGVTISGGERQRLCLARALLCNPAVLILDEATSALDANSEQLIQQSLDKAMAGRTVIVIAHRLATVRNANRIIALDNGRIVDQGTHEELTGRCTLYRELARKQFIE